MRWKTKLIAIASAGVAFAAIAAGPASAQVNFSLNLGTYGQPFAAPSNCYWQRFDRGRVDIVEQVCRDRYGRTYVVPGTRYTLIDQNRRQWRRWSNNDYRDWDRRNRRDWDDRRDRDRDWDRRDRNRDRDRDRDRDRRDRGRR